MEDTVIPNILIAINTIIISSIWAIVSFNQAFSKHFFVRILYCHIFAYISNSMVLFLLKV